MRIRRASSRKVRYAAALSKAAAVLGSEAAARQWMREPAMGLDRQVPAKLVSTAAGAELVDTFPEQLEYGVYVSFARCAPQRVFQNSLSLVPILREPWDLLERAFENNRFVSRTIRLAAAAAREQSCQRPETAFGYLLGFRQI